MTVTDVIIEKYLTLLFAIGKHTPRVNTLSMDPLVTPLRLSDNCVESKTTKRLV